MKDKGKESKEKDIKSKEIPKVYNLDKFEGIFSVIKDLKDDKKILEKFKEHLKKIVSDFKFNEKTILFIYGQDESINDNTADIIYRIIPKDNTNQEIIFFINSAGGNIEPAYLISKCCREYAKKFIVTIPRKAKSAATLLSFGANEIHMGTMSEMGPIDPQFGGLPALGLRDAVINVAKICKKVPEASDMFAKFLSNHLDLRILGLFERVSESAVQYGERLLEGKKLPNQQNPHSVAKQFVYSYKDHNFVIDKEEARKFLGENIKVDTSEYKFSDRIYNFLEMSDFLLGFLNKKQLFFVGDIDNLNIINLKEK